VTASSIVKQQRWVRRWRLAIVAGMALLVLGACFGALAYVDGEGRRLILDQEQQAVAGELDSFGQIQADEGEGGLVRSVARRAHLAGGHNLYALRDANGRLLAGNLNVWPRGIGANEAWREIDDIAPWRGARVATRPLDNGLVVLVGHDDAAYRAFADYVLDAVWVAVAVVALTCLAVAGAVTNYIMLRVRHLSDVAAQVSAGDYSARAQGAGGGGPFGEIAHALNDMLERIGDLVSGLRTVTDSLAHDLRTPLMRARREIEQGLLSDDAAAKHTALENALAETDRTISTFTSLIDIARAEGGLSREAMADVDLSALVADCYDLFEPLAEESGVTFTARSDAAHMKGHKALLMQAVSNLAHNAIKFTPRGGRVEIDARVQESEVEIVVADNGPGIASEQRKDAIKRFKRAADNDEAPEGLGLGLAIVDACARLHRGRLVLDDNRPGLRARLLLSAS
jgi:signal transduction histidine kinase